MTGFPPDVAKRLADTALVVIRTSAAPDAAVHETIIWIVVDDRRRAIVRAVRGRRGRWYRELLRHRSGALRIGDEEIRIRAEPATRAEVSACSELLRAKYPRQGASLRSMLRDEVLDATLVLGPG